MVFEAFARMSNFLKSMQSREQRLAWLVAVVADAIQIGALPLFAAGGLSPADVLLDVAVGAILIRLLGWHWAFLPSLVAELVPGFDFISHLDRFRFLCYPTPGSFHGSGNSSSRSSSGPSPLSFSWSVSKGSKLPAVFNRFRASDPSSLIIPQLDDWHFSFSLSHSGKARRRWDGCRLQG